MACERIGENVREREKERGKRAGIYTRQSRQKALPTNCLRHSGTRATKCVIIIE